MSLKSPYPYFGGKAKIAAEVWRRLGDVRNYVEPFFGSGAVLLWKDEPCKTETVNDLDGMVANFWRALQAEPDKVAEYADWPVNENDLHARHAWLVGKKDSLQTRLEGDPDYYDTKIAGWWVWGMACWIGGGFCSGHGPWQVVDGQLVHFGNAGRGVKRQLVHLGNPGRGVNRQLVHFGNAGQGVNRKRVRLGGFAEMGVNARNDIKEYMNQLAERMRRVRVCCGDWSRVCGPTPTIGQGLTGVFLDPPYSHAVRNSDLYRVEMSCADKVRDWAIEWGEHPLMRIALCGYEGEHDMPENWAVFQWNQGAGYGGRAKEQSGNGKKERIWFSPNCLRLDDENSLFGGQDVG